MFNGEFYSLALSEPLVAFHLNGGEMNEDIILTIVTANETVPLGGAKPSDSSNKTFDMLIPIFLILRFDLFSCGLTQINIILSNLCVKLSRDLCKHCL